MGLSFFHLFINACCSILRIAHMWCIYIHELCVTYGKSTMFHAFILTLSNIKHRQVISHVTATQHKTNSVPKVA